jgi:hypothetical protein
MAFAFMYPEAGQRGKKSVVRSILATKKLSDAGLSKARTVLNYSQDEALAVL